MIPAHLSLKYGNNHVRLSGLWQCLSEWEGLAICHLMHGDWAVFVCHFCVDILC